jgi:hypothetical protein
VFSHASQWLFTKLSKVVRTAEPLDKLAECVLRRTLAASLAACVCTLHAESTSGSGHVDTTIAALVASLAMHASIGNVGRQPMAIGAFRSAEGRLVPKLCLRKLQRIPQLHLASASWTVRTCVPVARESVIERVSAKHTRTSTLPTRSGTFQWPVRPCLVEGP